MNAFSFEGKPRQEARCAWPRLASSLSDKGPLTDRAISRYALAGRYGTDAALREQAALAARVAASVAAKEKAIATAKKKALRKEVRNLIKDLL